MSKNPSMFSGISAAGLVFLLLIFSTLACSSGSLFTTPTPFPTFTPYPTLTAYPTYTPLPPTITPQPKTWDVKILSAIKSRNFGEWYYEESVKSEYIILTIEYTYNGKKTMEFSPQSVVLVFPEGSIWPGYALGATDYQPENTSKVTNFYTQGPIMTYIKPGQTKVEKFAWGLTTNTDTKLRLIFPEAEPIDFLIDEN
jgi:hypothetical protein